MLDAIFRRFRSIANPVDGSLILPGDFLIQEDNNIEVTAKLNHHLLLRHAAVATGAVPSDAWVPKVPASTSNAAVHA